MLIEHRIADRTLKMKADLAKCQAVTKDCLIHVSSDLEAINAWLSSFDNPHTRRVYHKDAVRFVIWCGYVVGKHLADLKVADP